MRIAIPAFAGCVTRFAEAVSGRVPAVIVAAASCVLGATFTMVAAGCAPAAPSSLASTAPPAASITLAPTVQLSASPSQQFPAATDAPATAPSATAAQPTATDALALPAPGIQLGQQLAQQSYQVPITIRNLAPTSASFSFELQHLQSGYLLYRPDLPDLTGWFSLALDPLRTAQLVTLTDLLPDQAYAVQVALEGDQADLRPVGLQGQPWGPLRFRTPVEGVRNLRVGVIGDTGFGDATTTTLVDLMSEQSLDFVLHTGDVVYKAHEQAGPASAWALKYYWQFEPLLTEMPVYTVPGNHEYDADARLDGRPFFSHAFPAFSDETLSQDPAGHWYSFEQAGAQFLMLDSQLFHGVAGRSAQTAWLRDRLAQPGFRFTIAVLHTPPYTSGLHTNDGLAIRVEWLPLFESAGVSLVLSGHDHNYERIQSGGITYLVSGGGSRVLYPLSSQLSGSQLFARRSHFVLLEIDTESITLSAIGVDGETFDRAVITPPG